MIFRGMNPSLPNM